MAAHWAHLPVNALAWFIEGAVGAIVSLIELYPQLGVEVLDRSWLGMPGVEIDGGSTLQAEVATHTVQIPHGAAQSNTPRILPVP